MNGDPWRSRITGYGAVDPRQLTANPRNWRTHPDHQRDALEGVLTEVGWVSEVLVNTRTGLVVDGHLRVASAVRHGEPSVPVRYVDLNDAEERLILAMLDPLSALAGADSDQLAALLEGLEPADAAVANLLRELAPPLPKQLNPDDADLTPPDEPITQPGDLWLLGDHRLLCGDATNAEDVARLLDGAQIHVTVTSPPYAEQRANQYGGIAAEHYVDWFKPVAANVAEHQAADASYFLNIKEHCEDGQRHLYVKDLTLAHVRAWGWRLVDEFCWRKAHDGVPGGWPNRFKNAWEPVFHFSRQSALKFNPDAVLHESDNVFEYSPANTKSHSGSGFLRDPSGGRHPGLARPSNVLEIGESSEVLDHSAPFPVGLPAFFIRAFSDPGDIAFDPFMGAGTTLIAAEQTARAARGLELQPAYCDVIVRRWERVSGRQAQQTHA